MDNALPMTQQVMEPDNSPDFIVLKFADSKVPVFRESRNKDYIKYGDDNNYPEYLTHLFNKSAKHNAILTGKAFYIFGDGYENGDVKINRLGDTLNDISKKAIQDVEIYGGFRLEIIWNAAGKIAEIYHVDYTTIRVGKEGGYYFKESWDIKYNNREQEQYIPAFNPQYPFGSQIFAYNEYRPMTRFYPLPSYIGCNNYIETDIEISKYYLSAIRNGMMPSKMIQFFKGEPAEDKKREIEHRFARKFSGSENAGRFILVFNDTNASKSVQIDDLSASEVDKQFVELNKTCQQEIFSGHLVTSPMLFGIKTEGQIGGNTELYTAYNIFQNTYAKPKANAFDREINYLFSYSSYPATYKLKPTDPIGIQFDIKDVVNALPKQFVFENLGIPKDMWGLENIGSDNRPTPTTPLAPSTTVVAPGETASDVPVNDNLKNLSAKQLQHVNRVVRQYKKGQMTESMAKTMLRSGLGLSDTDINDILGIQPVQLSFEEEEDSIIAMFDACGESRSDFEILKSKKVSFNSEVEAEEDEEIFIQEAFKTYDVTKTEDEILQLIRKDPKVTPDVIAKAINQSVSYVNSKLKSLEQRGYLESSVTTIGEDDEISRSIPTGIDIKPPADVIKNPPAQVFIKYSYEGPVDSRNRPFCAKMMALKRLYSRAEIESISQRLGYSVFDRRGGFWRHKDGTTTPYCRHKWKSNIVVKAK